MSDLLDEQESTTAPNQAGDASEIVITPKGMGDRKEIQAAHQRIFALLPGAKNFPYDILWSLAQLAVAYRLDPFNGEIYAMKMGKEKVGNEWVDKYGVMIGIKGFRALAHRQSHYTAPPPRVMDAEEVKLLRRELYDPGDIGVEVQLYRLDVAGQCKNVGIPYYPTIGRGFYRVKAKAIKDKDGKITGYHPDNIPETWTARDVAEKRAEKTAITKAFDLRFDPGLMQDGEEMDGAIEQMASRRDRETAITMRPTLTLEEENGDVTYARDR